ncbi:MAG: hypothetical protein IJV94_02625 [Bacilli bacterium]|nr:hypothetical protein [Bacilli bacterium]
MKRKIILTLFLLFIVGCSNVEKKIPEKVNPEGFSVRDSSVQPHNLDEYLFIDDVMYVDVRPYSSIIKYGYVAGFQFVPYYDLIASRINDKTLFEMTSSGQTGSFIPNFIESEQYLNHLFPKDKIILAISEEGSECSYLFNLLKQYGYDPKNLYNVGGFANNSGFILAYRNLDDPKNLVPGNSLDISFSIDYNFTEKLTPVE